MPGLLIGTLLIGVAYILSLRGRGSRGEGNAFELRDFGKALYAAKFSLATPFIVLGGIYAGIFTPVEASVIAVVYALLVGVVVKRRVGLKAIWESLSEASAICGGLVVIMGTAVFFGEFLTLNQIPQRITASLLSVTRDPTVMLFLLAAILIVLAGPSWRPCRQ